MARYRASMDGWVACLCGKRVSMGGVGDMGDLLACVAWVE